jgi:serine/threonine protein kinase/formylglycine-generating enzyme required for sulfatase activity
MQVERTDEDLNVVVAFLGRYYEDLAAGDVKPPSEYQVLFPGHEGRIASEYARLASARTMALPEPSPARDRRIGGYLLKDQIGRGGQATVYLAEDSRLHRNVALKVFHRSTGRTLEDLLRFRREAEAASRLHHPGICPVFGAGEEDDCAWIAMAWIDGETLAAKIARARNHGGSSSPVLATPSETGLAGERATDTTRMRAAVGSAELRAVMRLFEAAARVLHVAHEAGVVHRDVKPNNIMVTPSLEPVLLDFGLASDSHSEIGTVTREGDVFGTPAYMSPEQISRKRGRVDRRSDIYSLGASLYETLTLRRPFEANGREALYRAILFEEPPDPVGLRKRIPRDLALVIATAMAKDPNRRYQTALEFAEDLRRVLAYEPIKAQPPGAWTKLRRWAQRNPALTGALGAALLLLFAGLGVSLALLSHARRALDESRILSDLRSIPNLERVAEEDLWPVHPSKAAAIAEWLADAEELLASVPGHRAALERERSPGPESERWRAQLRDLLRRVDAFQRTVDQVRARHLAATGLERLTIEDHRQEWGAASAAIASSSRYGGLRLPPQLGLVPVGPDPESGLWEFAHWLSGAVPERGSDGRLRLRDEDGIVLVLVPGGETSVGSLARLADDPELDEGASAPAAVDAALATSRRAAVQQVAPYFLAKYEMSQGQWLRVTGANPSAIFAGRPLPPDLRPATLRHPAENFSWHTAGTALRRVGLCLPSAAQWEHACRAGTSTPWHCGPAASSLQGFANVADRTVLRATGKWAILRHQVLIDKDLEDGHILTAPIGSFLPNAFGFHDMHGNVAEFCDDPGINDSCLLKGGSYRDPARITRASLSQTIDQDSRRETAGVRPARPID